MLVILNSVRIYLLLNYKGAKIAILICYSLELAKIKPDIIIVSSYTNDLYGK